VFFISIYIFLIVCNSVAYSDALSKGTLSNDKSQVFF